MLLPRRPSAGRRLSFLTLAFIFASVLQYSLSTAQGPNAGSHVKRAHPPRRHPVATGVIVEDPQLTRLLHGLKDPSAKVREQSAREIGKLGSEAKVFVPALIRLVTDRDPAVRRAAINAVRTIKPGPDVVLPLLSQALLEADPQSVTGALHSLAEIGEPAIPTLLKALDHPEARYWAVLVLHELGPKGAPAVPKLREALSDKRPDVRMQILLTLGEIGPGAKEAVPDVLKALKDPLPAVQYAALFATGKLAPATGAALPTLRANLKSKDPFIKVISSWAIIKLQPGDKNVLTANLSPIVEGLTSKDERLRRIALRALIDLRPGPALVLPALKRILDSQDPQVLEDSLAALASLGEPAVPALVYALQHGNAPLEAVMILGRMGPKAQPAVGELAKLLGSVDPELRREAAMTLAAIGPGAAPAASKLAEQLSNESRSTRVAAAYALGQIGKAAKQAVPALKASLKHSDPPTRGVSAWALAHISPDDPAIAAASVPLLVKALGDDRDLMRREAAEALGLFGKSARGAIPDLKKLQNDPYPSVAKAATSALDRIDRE